jgi:FkbM family methyltransferase
MNVVTIAEHSIDLSQINRSSKVLDLGCRAFTWSKAMLEYVDEVYCVDADPDIIRNKPSGNGYNLFLGAVNDVGGLNMMLHRSGNGTGNYVIPYSSTVRRAGDYSPIKSFTLKEISDCYKVEMWDVIKMDIESSEIPVLLSLTEPPAKQLSVEFHQHTGTSFQKVNEVVNHLLSIGYGVVQHEATAQHGAGLNFWDSLFIIPA